MENHLKQGSVIGILGGGQLGRMTAMDAARLGFRSHIFSPSGDVPATHVSARETIASFDDTAALEAFAKDVDVVTVETEHIPANALRLIEEIAVLHPSAKAVETCQHRRKEKQFINDAGVKTARWVHVPARDGIADAVTSFGLPCIIKTATGGYDGHGQMRLENDKDIAEAEQKLGSQECILEEIVAFELEASVVVARSTTGETAAYPTVRNDHRNHILWRTHAPAGVDPSIDAECRKASSILADALEIVGLLAIEFFIKVDGEVLVNELAPRPHNSGHWTMDGAQTPQFEQLVRAISGLPLGDPRLLIPTRMTNLLGEEVLEREAWCRSRNARIHLYGKSEIREGRKMGHVNELLSKTKE